jgi:hypothetical protein
MGVILIDHIMLLLVSPSLSSRLLHPVFLRLLALFWVSLADIQKTWSIKGETTA